MQFEQLEEVSKLCQSRRPRACLTHLLAQDSANTLKEPNQAVIRLDEDAQAAKVLVRLLRDLFDVDEERRLGGGRGRENEPGEEDGIVGDVGAAQVEQPCEETESALLFREAEKAHAQAISSSCVSTTPQHRLSPLLAFASPPKTSSFSISFLTRSILLFAPSPAYFSSSTNTSFFGLCGLPSFPSLFSFASASHATSTRFSLIGTSSTPADVKPGARVV